LLTETLRHKQQRYADQKRITTNAGETNSEIAERIAAASLDENNKGKTLNNEQRIGTIAEERGAKDRWCLARRPNIRLLAHMHEHSAKITRFIYL
jgi:hypothetical protein